jgi:formylglycine-generating enzyme required for sulfatase activity
MKLKSLFTAMVIVLSGMVAFANNIQVSNVSLTGRDVNNDFTMVKFNLSWENSWRTSSTPSNWDAAWVFVKYRVNGGNWQHAFLNNSGHIAASGSTVTTGLLTPSSAFNATTNPGVGVYVHRDADGSGNVSFNDLQVRWNYGANGIADNDLIDVQVYAIEMVYVPSGSFYLGSGGSYETGQYTNGSFTTPLQSGGASSLIGATNVGTTITISGTGASTANLQVGHVLSVITGVGRLGGIGNYDTVASIINSTSFTVKNPLATNLSSNAVLQVHGPTVPYQITSEGTVTVDNAPGALYGTSANNQTSIGSAPSNPPYTLPAAYPKGFAAFYCMKYEISQGQYVDFLNSLTRTQQTARVGTNISGTSITNRFVMSNSATVLSRNGIRCDATIPASSPVTFYNDLDADGVANESNDGQNIALNYMTGTDFLTYLDWSCLRIMTEFEFEKACRGTDFPTPNAYAWGTASATPATAITGSGTANESASSPANANVHANNVLTSGPIRVGSFATSTSTRTQAGATVYGIMDMTGNIWERTVTSAHTQGKAYTGVHGNGTITALGAADVAFWPTISNPVLAFRGGSFTSVSIPTSMISDRTNGTLAGNTRQINYGGRGVRTAQ